MPLSSGSKLGPYELVAPVGAGGMGEVYRARDTRLDRTVAIKILPVHLSDSLAARQRFEREARVISSLNHPHICHLYDIGSQDGVDFLVMEFLEGETLADRLRKGSMPPDQLLKCGIEICDGLEKAHKSGVVHRDLKPGNIMLTKSGAKLLDFGLAKAVDEAHPPSSGLTVTTASTRASQLVTAQGTVVGTFQYIAPEQLEGEEADARSDIFALGAVLYEMATGKRAFEGKTTASVIAAVMTSEPQPISAVQPLSPPALDRVIKTCLAKDPDQRFQNVHDINLQLEWIAEGGSQAGVSAPVPVRGAPEHLVWGLFAVASLLTLLFAILHFRTPTLEAHAVRFTIPPPDDANYEVLFTYGAPEVSPDGLNIAFVARSGGVTELWVRPLDSFKPYALAGTEGAHGAFWSPDGRSLGFFAQGKLKRIAISGGPGVPVCDVDQGRGGSWNRQDTMIFARFPGEIYQVPASGGQPKPITRLDASQHETSHRWPYFLPDGNHFLYMAGALGLASDENVIKIGSLDGRTDMVLFHASSPVAYDSGYLLFVANKSLMARPFDAGKLDFSGGPVTIAEDSLYEAMYSNAAFSASGTGVLLYMTGNAFNDSQLEAFDASGKSVSKLGEPGRMLDMRLSPDAKSVAFSLVDPNTGKADIWTQDLSSGNRTRITRDPRASAAPTWSRDSASIFYQSIRVSNKPAIFMTPSNGMGVEQKAWEPVQWGWPDDVTSDSKALIVEERSENGKSRVALFPLEPHSQTTPLFETPGANVFDARLCADGHWIAYESDESGKREVYVSSFPRPAGRLQVSSGGGRLPKWRGDGKELYYLDEGTQLVAVELNTSNSSVTVVRRRPLFQFPRGTNGYDVFPDGKRFLLNVHTNTIPAPLSLVLNWTADLKK